MDEDPEEGLVRLVECLELELRLLISALGKYRLADLSAERSLVAAASRVTGRSGPGKQNEVTT